MLQKIELKPIQKKFSKNLIVPEEVTDKQKKQATISMIFGIIGILLVLGGATTILAAIPLSIAALVLGIKSLKGNSNTAGVVGVVTGGVTIFLALLAIIYVIAVVAGGR